MRRLPRRGRPSLWFFAVLLLVATVRLLQVLQQPTIPESLPDGIHKVRRVVDGDTLLLDDGARVRLIGVDTPELFHRDETKNPQGEAAKRFTEMYVRGGDVELRFDKERRDQYGRFLAYVFVDGQMLNEALLDAGMARARTGFNYSEAFKRRFRAAERQAREDRIGIWSKRSS